MDIIHGLSNLEIETTDSSSQEVEVEEVEMRNWVELPTDVMSLILLKLSHVDILISAQWVCTSWWKLSKQPHLFRCIHVDKVFYVSKEHSVWLDPASLKEPREMGREAIDESSGQLVEYYVQTTADGVFIAREAIDRSCGQLLEFSAKVMASLSLLRYMSEKSSSLRCFRVHANYFKDSDIELTDDGLIETAKKLPLLEELEIIHADFSKDVIETFGQFCPKLKSCQLNFVTYNKIGIEFDGVALAIAENMPELCHLSLFGNKLMDDDGLGAILDGCPHLESLDLRRCFDLNISGDLEKRCRNIKVLRLPNDPIDDFEYDFSNDLSDEEYNSYDSRIYVDGERLRVMDLMIMTQKCDPYNFGIGRMS